MATQVSQRLPSIAGTSTSSFHPVAQAAQKRLANVFQANTGSERPSNTHKVTSVQAQGSSRPEADTNHGRHIWIYNKRDTKQVIYSLTRALDNDSAMAQLTYVGKKSVPSHIRADMWNPFAIVTFPVARQGLEAFRLLREFRLRHEYEWREHLDKPNYLPKKYQRMRLLQNQTPNSVADLAATLAIQERVGLSNREKRKLLGAKQEEIAREQSSKLPEPPRTPASRDPSNTEKLDESDQTEELLATISAVKIMWADANDRHYAESWPKVVEHETMGTHRGTAPHPVTLRNSERELERSQQLLNKYKDGEARLLLRYLGRQRESPTIDAIVAALELKTWQLEQQKQRPNLLGETELGEEPQTQHQLKRLELRMVGLAARAARKLAESGVREEAPRGDTLAVLTKVEALDRKIRKIRKALALAREAATDTNMEAKPTDTPVAESTEETMATSKVAVQEGPEKPELRKPADVASTDDTKHSTNPRHP